MTIYDQNSNVTFCVIFKQRACVILGFKIVTTQNNHKTVRGLCSKSPFFVSYKTKTGWSTVPKMSSQFKALVSI